MKNILVLFLLIQILLSPLVAFSDTTFSSEPKLVSKVWLVAVVDVEAIGSPPGSASYVELRVAARNLLFKLLAHFDCDVPMSSLSPLPDFTYGYLNNNVGTDLFTNDLFTVSTVTSCRRLPELDQEVTNDERLYYSAAPNDYCENENCNFIYQTGRRVFVGHHL